MGVILESAVFAMAAILLALGAAVCLNASNIAKRMVSLCVALIGAVLGAAALHAGDGAVIAGAAIAAAYAAVGFSALVRLQEAYASVEAEDIDAADLADEPAEPRA